MGPELAVSLSSDVMPDMREYERASTAVANAYVQPVVRSYLDRLADGLQAAGIAADLMLIGSDAGTIGRAAALRYPVRLVESGPAGGALAASFLGRRAGEPDVIAFDVGGTTAKVCVIDGGEPERADEFEVARVHRFAKGSGLPLKVPVIEMIEIGAGGGSIARVDELGLLRVGPDSAAANPGPACYGLGGELPTVTDADLVLGYLDAEFFLGGAMRLDRERAAAAIRRHVAEPLRLSPTRAAWGIHAVVNDNMARAAKVHCLERGKDARDYVLLAYGGAGPVHAAQVAAALGIKRVMYPLRAGVMSALGFLAAPVAFERLRAEVSRLDAVDLARANAILAELAADARELVRAAGVPNADCMVKREAGIAFRRAELCVAGAAAAGSPDPRALAAAPRGFRRHLSQALLPSQSGRAGGARPLARVGGRPEAGAPYRADRIRDARRAQGDATGLFFRGRPLCRLRGLRSLRVAFGKHLRGPAVIEEPESTVVIGPGSSSTIDRDGNLMVTLASGRAPRTGRRHEYGERSPRCFRRGIADGCDRSRIGRQGEGPLARHHRCGLCRIDRCRRHATSRAWYSAGAGSPRQR